MVVLVPCRVLASHVGNAWKNTAAVVVPLGHIFFGPAHGRIFPYVNVFCMCYFGFIHAYLQLNMHLYILYTYIVKTYLKECVTTVTHLSLVDLPLTGGSSQSVRSVLGSRVPNARRSLQDGRHINRSLFFLGEAQNRRSSMVIRGQGMVDHGGW